MKIATLLYGQQRTLKYTFPSIKHLFKNILKTNFYVVINETNDTNVQNNLSNNDYDNLSQLELDNLINELNPIIYEKINIDQKNIKNLVNNNNEIMNRINNNNFYSTNWDEYNKMPKSESLFNVDECLKYNCKLNKIERKINVIIDVGC